MHDLETAWLLRVEPVKGPGGGIRRRGRARHIGDAALVGDQTVKQTIVAGDQAIQVLRKLGQLSGKSVHDARRRPGIVQVQSEQLAFALRGPVQPIEGAPLNQQHAIGLIEIGDLFRDTTVGFGAVEQSGPAAQDACRQADTIETPAFRVMHQRATAVQATPGKFRKGLTEISRHLILGRVIRQHEKPDRCCAVKLIPHQDGRHRGPHGRRPGGVATATPKSGQVEHFHRFTGGHRRRQNQQQRGGDEGPKDSGEGHDVLHKNKVVTTRAVIRKKSPAAITRRTKDKQRSIRPPVPTPPGLIPPPRPGWSE